MVVENAAQSSKIGEVRWVSPNKVGGGPDAVNNERAREGQGEPRLFKHVPLKRKSVP